MQRSRTVMKWVPHGLLCLSFTLAMPSTIQALPPVDFKDVVEEASERIKLIERAAVNVRAALDAPADPDLASSETMIELAAQIARRHQVCVVLSSKTFRDAGMPMDVVPQVAGAGRNLRQFLELLLSSGSRTPRWIPHIREGHGFLQIGFRLWDESLLANKPSQQPYLREIRLTGVIRTSAAEPAAGAVLIAENFYSSQVTVADAEGRFLFPDAVTAADSLRILIRDANASEMQFWRRDPPTPLEFQSAKIVEVRKRQMEISLAPARTLRVEVTDKKGQPVSAAKVGMHAERTVYTQMTDRNGVAQFSLPTELTVVNVAAYANGVGLDFLEFKSSTVNNRVFYSKVKDVPQTIPLLLTGARTLRIQLTDDVGAPLPGIVIGPQSFAHHNNKSGLYERLRLSAIPEFATEITDAEGKATIAWLPDWQGESLDFEPDLGTGFAKKKFTVDPQRVGDNPIVFVAPRLVSISGSVVLADGTPVPSARLTANGKGHDSFTNLYAYSDANGRYQIEVGPNQIYLLTAEKRSEKVPLGGLRDGFIVKPGQPLTDFDIPMQPMVRFFGRVTKGQKQEPVAKHSVSLTLLGRALPTIKDVFLPGAEQKRLPFLPSIQTSFATDAEGRFVVLVIPGEYGLMGTVAPLPPLPNRPIQFANRRFPRLTISEIPAAEAHFHLEDYSTPRLTGTIVAGTPPRAVSQAEVRLMALPPDGTPIVWAVTQTMGDGMFEVERIPTVGILRAVTTDGKLAGMMELDPNVERIELTLTPTATVTVGLIDDNRQPIPPGRLFHWGMSSEQNKGTLAPMPFEIYGGEVRTDDQGNITLKNLLVGVEHDLRCAIEGKFSKPILTIHPQMAGEQAMPNQILRIPAD